MGLSHGEECWQSGGAQAELAWSKEEGTKRALHQQQARAVTVRQTVRLALPSLWGAWGCNRCRQGREVPQPSSLPRRPTYPASRSKRSW